MRNYLCLRKLISSPPQGRGLFSHFAAHTQFEKPDENPILCTNIQIIRDKEIGEYGQYKINSDPQWSDSIKDTVKNLNDFIFDPIQLRSDVFSFAEIKQQVREGKVGFQKPIPLYDYFFTTPHSNSEIIELEKQYIKATMGEMVDKNSFFLPIPVQDQGEWEAVIYLVYNRNQLDTETNGTLDQLEDYLMTTFY